MLNNRKLRIRNYELPLLLVTVLLISLLFATVVSAQGSEPTDDDVNKIAKQLYCPVCESTPLDVCPTEACRQWRDLIRQMLSDGKSEEEIKQYFVTQYGVRVLNEPPNKLVSYIVPVIAFLAGVFILFRGFKMWLKPVGTEAGLPVEDDAAESVQQDDYIRQLEEELKKKK